MHTPRQISLWRSLQEGYYKGTKSQGILKEINKTMAHVTRYGQQQEGHTNRNEQTDRMSTDETSIDEMSTDEVSVNHKLWGTIFAIKNKS